MSESDTLIESKLDSNGKNAESIYCTFCPCKILNPGCATYVNIDFPLPHIMRKRDDDADKREPVRDYWLVQEITNFENIGVSYKVENQKYLACADCEKGPVGWLDISTSKSYIALSRVKHQKPDP